MQRRAGAHGCQSLNNRLASGRSRSGASILAVPMFEDRGSVTFEQYLATRLRGAMIDELRRQATISLVAIPLSLLGAGLMLLWSGATINVMIIAGLVIALGEVVDKMVKSNAWKEILKQKGWDDAYMQGDEFAKFLANEQTRVAAAMKTVGLVK